MPKKRLSIKRKTLPRRNSQQEMSARMETLCCNYAAMEAREEQRRDELRFFKNHAPEVFRAIDIAKTAICDRLNILDYEWKATLREMQQRFAEVMDKELRASIEQQAKRLENCVDRATRRLTSLETEQAKAQITPLVQGANALAEHLNELRDKLWNGA